MGRRTSRTVLKQWTRTYELKSALDRLLPPPQLLRHRGQSDSGRLAGWDPIRPTSPWFLHRKLHGTYAQLPFRDHHPLFSWRLYLADAYGEQHQPSDLISMDGTQLRADGLHQSASYSLSTQLSGHDGRANVRALICGQDLG
jgi:hypothetical protein